MSIELRWIRSNKYGGKYVLQTRESAVYSENEDGQQVMFNKQTDWQDVPYEKDQPVWCEHIVIENKRWWMHGTDSYMDEPDSAGNMWNWCPICGKNRPN